MSSVERVLIVGGGISGTALASQLQDVGISAEIVEIEPEWTFRGIGIAMMPPAMRSLKRLGVLDECVAAGFPQGPARSCNAAGEVLTTTVLESLTGPEDPASIGMPRGALGRILYERALGSGATARLGLSVDSVESDDDGVDVVFTDGSEARYDLVVGADGVRSKLRRMLFPEQEPASFLGQSIWRVLASHRMPEVDGQIFYSNQTTRAGFNPITKDDMYVYVLHETEENEPRLPDRESLELFLELLGEYGGELLPKARDLFTLESPFHYGPLYSGFIEGSWHRGRVLMIGDAAHATPPHLASGAGIAMEDAIVLPELLGEGNPVEQALDEFHRRRYDRCRMVIENSRQLSAWDRDPDFRGPEAGQLTAESWQLLAQPI
jgi:2-polyprenyl-6-methoxyphenol hydroxylase-like FAD-dependent oxidoreductase